MSDLIERQAAIDAMEQAKKQYFDRKVIICKMQDIVINLPSAQPDSKELSFTHKALDTISRQDAIRIVDGIDTWQAGWRGDAIESMKALPSAQPKPCEDADKLKRCKFEYINACKIVARPTPDTNKSDIYDAYAVIKALHPIFGDEEF